MYQIITMYNTHILFKLNHLTTKVIYIYIINFLYKLKKLKYQTLIMICIAFSKL